MLVDRHDRASAVAFVRSCELPGWPPPEAAHYRDPGGLLHSATRQWFEVHIRQPQRRWPLGLPSVAVRRCWESMAADPGYPDFCRSAFGAVLPVAVSMSSTPRTWEAACRAERIDARSPAHLPVLFLVDATLRVPGGLTYTSRCSGRVCRVFPPEICVRHAFAPPRFFSFYRDDSGVTRPT
ncbi:MAG: hypothetical protein WCA29_04765 [Jiangellales bacterium]